MVTGSHTFHYFLPTKNHSWIGTVPLHGGNFDVVIARNGGWAIRTRDEVEGLAECIDSDWVEQLQYRNVR